MYGKVIRTMSVVSTVSEMFFFADKLFRCCLGLYEESYNNLFEYATHYRCKERYNIIVVKTGTIYYLNMLHIIAVKTGTILSL